MDNASDDGTSKLLHGVDVLRTKKNLGYAGGIAVALPHVETEFVAWLNDDAAPEPGWLGALEDRLDERSDAAAVSSVLITPTGVVQSRGVLLSGDGHGADVTAEREEVFGFCGGATLLRTEALRAAGGVPADFFCYYEDTETAWRLRLRGHEIVPAPTARVTHLHGASTKPGSRRFHRWNERNRLLMLLRCAPAEVAVEQLARFAALTAALPFRRSRPEAANFSVRLRLRLRVLGEVVVRLPGALAARRRIGTSKQVRSAVWRKWAGQTP